MLKKIAVETLTLKEIAALFDRSLEKAIPSAMRGVEIRIKKLARNKIKSHKWIQTYEIFKGAILHFYCEKLDLKTDPVINVGMTHRTSKGMILVVIDISNGGLPNIYVEETMWKGWVIIYTGHYCERYAERIARSNNPTFKAGCDAIMFDDNGGVMRVKDSEYEGIEDIEYQFKDGQAYGFRDNKNKLTLFRTVYSNDMLTSDRLDFMEESKESIAQLYDLVKL
jgi:hypothetical protein